MPIYNYKGVNGKYEYTVGEVEADDPVEAIRIIKEEEDILIVVGLTPASKFKTLNAIRATIEARVIFFENKIREKRRSASEKKTKNRSEGGGSGANDIFEKSPILKALSPLLGKKNKGSTVEVSGEIYEQPQSIFKDDPYSDISGHSIDYTDDLVNSKIKRTEKGLEDSNDGIPLNWELLDTAGSNDPIVKKNNKVKVDNKELLMFTRRLHIMLSSGVSLLSSLLALQESSSKGMETVIANVLEEIRMGSMFSEAIAKYPKIFDSSYVSLIAIGETSGELAASLVDIIKMKEQEQKVMKKVKTASIYPAIVGIVLVIMMTAASVFFLPKFEEMYEDQELSVPGFTRVVFDISGMLPYVLITIAILTVLLFVLKKRIPKLNQLYVGTRDKLLLKTPIVKDVTNALYMYYFSSTVSLMLKNGIRLSDTLALAGKSINNIYIRSEIENISQLMTYGFSFSEAMRKQPHFDDILVNIAFTGEESGQMIFALTKVSEYFDTELNNKVDAMMEVLPPMSIVVISVLTAPVIIAAYLPILEMSSGSGVNF